MVEPPGRRGPVQHRERERQARPIHGAGANGDVTARGLFAASAHAGGKGCGTRAGKDDKAENDVHREQGSKERNG